MIQGRGLTIYQAPRLQHSLCRKTKNQRSISSKDTGLSKSMQIAYFLDRLSSQKYLIVLKASSKYNFTRAHRLTTRLLRYSQSTSTKKIKRRLMSRSRPQLLYLKKQKQKGVSGIGTSIVPVYKQRKATYL